MRGYKNFEGSPHPGDLKHLVEIGYTVNEVNANGYPEATDVVLCRVWASATDAGNQHYRSADHHCSDPEASSLMVHDRLLREMSNHRKMSINVTADDAILAGNGASPADSERIQKEGQRILPP